MPDFGLSKDSLRNLVNLAGEFVGTTDTLTLTNKTINTTDNTLTSTSRATGDILKDNGTKLERLARGTANQALVTNSGGTDVAWGTVAVAGGGTGATTLTGILKGAGTSAITAVAAPTGALLGDSDVQNISGGKTFFNQTLKRRNPANTFTLTEVHPSITADSDFRFNTPMTFFVYIDGSTYYARSGLTQAIVTSSADAGIVLNTILALMTSTGGIIHLAAGLYATATQITVPQHNGKSIIIEGEGYRNTTIEWTGSADASKYVIESFSTGAADWQIVTFKDLQIWGGTSTSNRLVHCLHLGRTQSTSVANYQFYNVRIANGVSAQVVANYLQDSYWYFVYCESLGSTPTGIVDLALTGSAHCNLEGCNIGATTVNESRLNMLGGTAQYIDYQVVSNYTSAIIGTFFDPVPPGFTHQIQIGTTGNVIGVRLENVGFAAVTNTPATDRYIYVNNAKNVTIDRPKFMSASTVATYIEITSNSIGTIVHYPPQEALSKITDAGTDTTILNPYINNNLYINNPSGTLGASLIDSFTSNRIELAQGGINLYNSVTSSSGSAKVGWRTRNAAANAYVTRLTCSSLANVGLASILSFENISFSGGVSLVPFLKAGVPADGDFLNPVSGLVALDTTNGVWYARVGTVWTALGGHVVTVAKGGTGATTLTGVLKGNGTSAITAAAQLAVADGGTGAATATAAFDALSSMTTLGDTQYGGASGTRTRLAGNITAVKQYLSQTGNGSVSAAPAWATPKCIGQFDFFNIIVTTGTNTVNYHNMNLQSSNATETLLDLIWDYTVTVKRFRLNVNSNAKTANTVVSLRDDGADVVAITIATGVTGEQDSGAVSVDIAAGSKINWKVDTSASASGAITMWGWVVWEATLQ